MDPEQSRIIEISLAKIENSKSRKTNGKHYSHSQLHKNLMVSSLLTKALRTNDGSKNQAMMEYREPKIIDFDMEDTEYSSFSQNVVHNGVSSSLLPYRHVTLSNPRTNIVKELSHCCEVYMNSRLKTQTEQLKEPASNVVSNKENVVQTKSSSPLTVDTCRNRGKRLMEDRYCSDVPSPCKRTKQAVDRTDTLGDNRYDVAEPMDCFAVSSLTTLLGSSFRELRTKNRDVPSDEFPGHLPSFHFENPAGNSWPCVTVMAC